MNTDRIKEIQQETAYPESVSVQQALLKVWNETKQEQLRINAVMRRATGIMFKGKELLDGDIVAQHCQMIDDYTGKTSIELNRLLISWNGKNWDVKCIDAMVGYRNNFWGYIPRFHELVGNAIDNSELLYGGAVWKPYA